MMMIKNFGSKVNSNGLDKNPKNINKSGRKRHTTRQFIEKYSDVEEFSIDEYVKVSKYLLSMTEKDWLDVYWNLETKSWVRLLIFDLMNPTTRLKKMNDLTDRLFGKAKEEFVFSGEVAQTVTAIDRPIQVIVNGIVK